MTLGLISLIFIVLWGGLTIANVWQRPRFILFLFSHAMMYACVFVYGIDNHNYMYAIIDIVLTVALGLVSFLRTRNMSDSSLIPCGILSVLLGLFVFTYYYVLPSAVSIGDLSH